MDSEVLHVSVSDGTIKYLKDILKYGRNSSYSSTIRDSIKFLRWWCNCQSNKYPQDPPFVKSLTKGIVKLREDKLFNDTANETQSNAPENLYFQEIDDKKPESAPTPEYQSFMLLSLKICIVLLLIICVLYIFNAVRQKWKNTTQNTPHVKTSVLQITKTQEFQGGSAESLAKKSGVNVLIQKVLTPTRRMGIEEAAEMSKLPVTSRKGKSPNDETVLKTERTQPCSSPTCTDRAQCELSTDATQKTASPAPTTKSNADAGKSVHNTLI